MELIKVIGYNRSGQVIEKYLPKKFVETQMKLPENKRRGFMKTAKSPQDAIVAGSREFNNLITLAGGLDKVKELLNAADASVASLANPAPQVNVVEAPVPKQTRTKKVSVSDELKAEIENLTGNE
jgi:ABC-type hemin transport system substrate-binding protein